MVELEFGLFKKGRCFIKYHISQSVCGSRQGLNFSPLSLSCAQLCATPQVLSRREVYTVIPIYIIHQLSMMGRIFVQALTVTIRNKY